MNKVLLEKHDGYAIVTLNRPAEMNALSRELRDDFVTALADCCADESVRVLVLTGAGKAFCAGFDLKELSESASDASQEADNVVARAMEKFEGPIIGAINGHAITGGFEMALACDVLIGSDKARFADTHVRVGILPGWGLSQKLSRLIGLSRAKEMHFTGAPVFAQQAYEWGIINHVVSEEALMPLAISMAEDMAACVPQTLKAYKPLVDQGYSMSLAKALPWEEEQAIESARLTMASMIARRKDAVLAKGRSETND
ncbi:MAG: enoyl-CoA hydratase [Halioglobus sp.]